MHDITADFPKYSEYEFHKQWILAEGWNSRNELNIKEDVLYKNVRIISLLI